MSGNVIHADHYIEIIGAISRRWKRGLLLDKFSSSVAAAVWQLCVWGGRPLGSEFTFSWGVTQGSPVALNQILFVGQCTGAESFS